ncbi:MAG: hypothetical protein JNK64_32830 [Myxococcales bacterium]|nr:hypothetical protein [Myxococcales bacterium]
MGRSLAMFASVSIACAGAAAPSATAPGPTPPPAVTVDAGPSSPPVDAAPAIDAPPPIAAVATFANLLTAGPASAEDVAAALAGLAGPIAACARHAAGSVAVEVRATLTPAGVTALAPLGPVAPERAALAGCVVDAVPIVAAAPSDDPTFAYAVVAIDRADQPPAARPALPDVRVDFETACSMFARSGAMDRPVEERWDVAQAYFRDHVRHPLLYRMAWEIASAAPQVRARIPVDYRKRVKPRRCDDPGW